MKNLRIILLVAALAMTTLPALAMGPLDLNADLTYNSKYVWRGITVTDEAVLQPGISGSVAGFGFGIWGNMDMTDVGATEKRFNEIDYTLTYGLSLPMIELGAGLIYYDFPTLDDANTTELYVGAAANVLFSPSITIYLDIDAIKGAYWELGISHSVPAGATASVDLSAGLGLGSESYLLGYYKVIPNPLDITDTSDFTGASMCDFHVTAGVPFSATPFFTITPSLTYFSLLGDAKDSALGHAEDDQHNLFGVDQSAIFYGLTASFSF